MVEIVFETHSITYDNEHGIATGWLHGELSPAGREAAAAMGERRRNDGIDAVFCSDLGRAVETANVAFGGTGIPIHQDPRLRECNYGQLNGTPVAGFEGRRYEFLDTPYPGGESWRDAIGRLEDFLGWLADEFSGKRVLVIGHSAQRFGFEHFLHGRRLEDVVDAPFNWQEGWEYSYE